MRVLNLTFVLLIIAAFTLTGCDRADNGVDRDTSTTAISETQTQPVGEPSVAEQTTLVQEGTAQTAQRLPDTASNWMIYAFGGLVLVLTSAALRSANRD